MWYYYILSKNSHQITEWCWQCRTCRHTVSLIDILDQEFNTSSKQQGNEVLLGNKTSASWFFIACRGSNWSGNRIHVTGVAVHSDNYTTATPWVFCTRGADGRALQVVRMRLTAVFSCMAIQVAWRTGHYAIKPTSNAFWMLSRASRLGIHWSKLSWMEPGQKPVFLTAIQHWQSNVSVSWEQESSWKFRKLLRSDVVRGESSTFGWLGKVRTHASKQMGHD